VAKLHCVKVDEKFKPLPGTEFDLDQRGNVRANLDRPFLFEIRHARPSRLR
jgi:hypothetical protein